MDLLCDNESFASHLISANFETSAFSKPHVLIARATSIGLVRLAQEAASAAGFRAFSLMVHLVVVVIFDCMDKLMNSIIEVLF
jgi:hypothetical protein